MKFKSRPNGRIVHNVKFNITGNVELIQGIQNFLVITLGFSKTKLNIRHNNVENIVTMEYSGRTNIKKFYDLIYSKATIFCKAKKEKFEEIFCAFDEKSLNETGLIAGTPEMVISSQAEINSEGSSTIPEMEVESSDSKCPALSE